MKVKKSVFGIAGGVGLFGILLTGSVTSWAQDLSSSGLPQGPGVIAPERNDSPEETQGSSGPNTRKKKTERKGQPIVVADDNGSQTKDATSQDEEKKKKKEPQKSQTTPFPVGQAPVSKNQPPTIETIVSATGILVPKGKLLVQDTMSYVHNTASQLALQGFTVLPAILIGSINIESVSQDIYTDILTFYYGLTDKLELETDVPYVYRTENVLTRTLGTGTSSQIQTNTEGAGLGDIQFGLHYQFNTVPEDGFFFLGNVLAKSNTGSNPFTTAVDTNGILTRQPTGSGFWSVEPGITVLFPDDPVTFYGNASYVYNFSTNFGGNIGTINPGNMTDFNLGAGFSLNEKASFSIGYDQMTLWPPSQNGVQIPLTHVLQMGSLLFGYSYNVSRFFFYMLNVEAGVTPDAPNVQISFRFPLIF